MRDDPWHDVRAAVARPPVQLTQDLKRSAVAALVTEDRQLWFMRRSQRKGDPWSGHLSFPGGREEDHDSSLLATAMRETMEEVGVDLTEAELLGPLDDLRTRPVRSMMIRPFVFALRQPPTFTLNYEVASMHSISLDDLLRGEGRTTMRWPTSSVGVRLPCVDFDGVRLWGLTLAVVDDLLDRIDGRGRGLTRP